MQPRADLTHATLFGPNLTGADLTSANLFRLFLNNANLDNADLTNAWLYSASLNGVYNWSTATWTEAKYSLNAVDNSGNPIADTIFPDGMNQAWRDAAGMVAVPEPTTALLLGLGLAGLAVKRSAHTIKT